MAEENTFSVEVQTSTPKRISVTSNVSENPITASADTGLYYSQLSKNWAIGEGLIQNEDYSSKTWAGESKSSADLSKMYSETASLDLNNLETRIIEYDEQLSTTITEGLDNINTSVTSGVETIETLQANSIAEITTNKETALSDISTAETNALNNIDTDLNNATSEIDTNRTNTLAQISTLANTSIADINAVGKSYDNLTYRNITNCLLEVPQRIKYTLENGTLTIKAGSVVIVPYGTEDLSSTYPVGATFLNDNFKVYDTQFVDGKFFVWAELVEDSVSNQTTSIAQNKIISIQITYSNIITHNYTESGTATTAANAWTGYYNTSTNLIGRSDSTTNIVYNSVLSFPILLGVSSTTQMFHTISQVFNGIGYIGSTLWVDKGVKGLIPNGRNEDGTLRGIEVVTTKISINYANSDAKHCGINAIGDPYFADITYYYNEKENINIQNNVFWAVCTIADIDVINGNITSFNPKQPFRAIDYSDKSEISGWGIPSSRYVDLTLGASGTTYIAPSNGWFYLSKNIGTNGQYCIIDLIRNGVGLYGLSYGTSTTGWQGILPCLKGDVLKITYTLSGTTAAFRFIYAQGEV